MCVCVCVLSVRWFAESARIGDLDASAVCCIDDKDDSARAAAVALPHGAAAVFFTASCRWTARFRIARGRKYHALHNDGFSFCGGIRINAMKIVCVVRPRSQNRRRVVPRKQEWTSTPSVGEISPAVLFALHCRIFEF